MSNLLTEELRKALPILREQERSDDPVVYAIFSFTLSGWHWFVVEGQPDGNDFLFFGYVVGFEAEWGYFTLTELEHINIRGLVIERDRCLEPAKLSTLLSDLNLK